jgi:hypothetical protein
MSSPHTTTSDEIRVKVLSTPPQRIFLHQLPGGGPSWGKCRFSFDPEDRDYDWLVVYDDLGARRGMQRTDRYEVLACPRVHTLLTTSEPSTIKHFGNAYTAQFGHVLTSQAEWALPHPNRIYSQAGLHWYYGVGQSHEILFDEMVAHPPTKKTADLAMLFSPKRNWHTLHQRRFNFMRYLMQHLPEMMVYGRGVRPLDDKAESLDSYRYSIAIENFIGPHHWTEKLADAFLGHTLPFYAGCTNATDYFPAASFIPIDIHDPEGAVRIIREAIANHEYEKRLAAIQEARQRVLFEHNFFALISRLIEARHTDQKLGASENDEAIYSRHALRKQSPLIGLQDVYGKARALFMHQIMRKN